jgi:hypothetical protein
MIAREFIAAGRAIFTVSVPASFVAGHPECRDRYTFQVKRTPATNGTSLWFINMLAGPDNSRDYSPLGCLNVETGAVRLVRSTQMNDRSWPVKLIRRVMACLWEVANAKPEDILRAGFEIRHEGRCGRCGRRLTVPLSIDTGLGPICAGKSM